MTDFTINVKVSGEVHIPELGALLCKTAQVATPKPTVSAAPAEPIKAPKETPKEEKPVEAPKKPSYSIEQITRAGALLAQQGADKLRELGALLQKYQLKAVTELKPEQTEAFVADLRGLGADI